MRYSVRHRAHEGGYILLITLIFVSLAATVLSGISLAAFRRLLDAQQRAEELQCRWGSISCRNALLPRAETLLQSAEAKEHGSIAQRLIQLPLGEQAFDILICDEQAKINLNDLYDRRGPIPAQQILEHLAVGSPLKLPLKPPDHFVTAPAEQSFTSPAQFLGRYEPELIFPVQGARSATTFITCWGDSRITLRRAPREVALAAGAPEITEYDVGRLLELLEKDPALTVSRAIAQLGLTEIQRLAFAQRFTDASTCHSMAIVCSSRQCKWYRLYVSDTRPGKPAKELEFQW